MCYHTWPSLEDSAPSQSLLVGLSPAGPAIPSQGLRLPPHPISANPLFSVVFSHPVTLPRTREGPVQGRFSRQDLPEAKGPSLRSATRSMSNSHSLMSRALGTCPVSALTPDTASRESYEGSLGRPPREGTPRPQQVAGKGNIQGTEPTAGRTRRSTGRHLGAGAGAGREAVPGLVAGSRPQSRRPRGLRSAPRPPGPFPR